MRHIATSFVVFILICLNVVFLSAQAPAQKSPDTVFEIPGRFRISLPPGWQQRAETTADTTAIAVFSKGDLRAKVSRDVSTVPGDDFARSVTSHTPQIPDNPTLK